MHFSTSIVAIVATLSTVVQSFIVTGATGGISNIGARQIRQDIIKMQSAGGPAWDLYIQALQMFQQKNQTDQVGWFQFMGKCRGFDSFYPARQKTNDNCRSSRLSLYPMGQC